MATFHHTYILHKEVKNAIITKQIQKSSSGRGIEPGTSGTASWCVTSGPRKQLNGGFKPSYLTVLT